MSRRTPVQVQADGGGSLGDFQDENARAYEFLKSSTKVTKGPASKGSFDQASTSTTFNQDVNFNLAQTQATPAKGKKGKSNLSTAASASTKGRSLTRTKRSEGGVTLDEDTVNKKLVGQHKGWRKHCPEIFKLLGWRPQDVQDTEYRLQEIILPKWVMILAEVSLIWEFCLYVMTVITFALVTYSAFFAFYEGELWHIIFITDIIFNMDLIMRLCVEYWRHWNEVNFLIFTVPYTMFIMDVISIMPFHLIYTSMVDLDDLKNLSKIDFWRFNRFIRLYRSYIFFRTLQQERRANEKMVFLLRFTNYYIGFIHFTACVLMLLTGLEPLDFLLMRKRNELNSTWMQQVTEGGAKIGYPTETPWQLYVLATNLATAVVTTVGYGDLYATNEVEMMWCIFFMLFGAIFLNGYFQSQLTTFELELDGARFDLFFRVNEIKKYLTKVGTVPLFNAKVDEYYKYLWSYREGVYEVQFMKHLPLAFQEDVLFDICQEMFDKSFLFHGTDEALLRAVSKIVKIALYNPEMSLCKKRGYANKMYYILQGECIVMSKYIPGKAAAVLRAGSIIGEANLLFSYPYTVTVETRTCCQFIILEKEELIRALDDFRDQLYLLRSRSQAKIVRLYESHEIFGIEPVCWVGVKTNMDNPGGPKLESNSRTMRWGSGRNRIVSEDVIDDSKDAVIFDTPCFKKEIIKNHLTPYISSVVPEIMDTELEWIVYWNYIIMITAAYYAFTGPYCVSFGENSQTERALCLFLDKADHLLALIYILDVFAEILAAAPVYGLHYKFWDGIKVKRTEYMFYMDILAAVPLKMFSLKVQSQEPINLWDCLFKSLKLWKIIRFLHFLDNRYPLYLFWFRFARTMLVLMYGMHFIACISYVLACEEKWNNQSSATLGVQVECQHISWLASYEITWRSQNSMPPPKWMETETLRSQSPYLYSFFYSSATLTSAGFGDFNPQRLVEMLWAILFQLIGFYLIGYYTSTLTSSLSCVVRPKLAFQQKLVSIRRFMTENNLKEVLRDRIIEYFNLQNQLRGRVTLGKGIFNLMYDCPEYLRDDVLYLEVVNFIEGIPLFSKVESEVVIKISSMMKRFLIPPNTTFLHKGEIRRVMYLIKDGSVGIYGDHSKDPVNILESSSHFGVRDLLFGEPSHFTIKSLSHVRMYSIKIHQLQEAMGHDEEFWDFVRQEKENIQGLIDQMITIYSQMTKPTVSTDYVAPIPNWVKLPKRPEMISPTTKQADLPWEQLEPLLINQEYDSLFKTVKFGWIWKIFLMRQTVHPVGSFASFWGVVTSTTSFLTLLFLFVETFTAFRRPEFRLLQWSLDLIAIMDLYIKLHWAYFNTHRNGNSMLITHPLKTALNYILNGTFIMDVCGCTPLEVIFPVLGWTDFFGYGDAATWYTKFRWTRVLQIKRLTMSLEIAHTVFNHRNTVLLLLYVIMTTILCSLLGSICLFFSCPWTANIWQKGDELRMPLCLYSPDIQEEPKWWVTVKASSSGAQETISSPITRWILSLYYVSQVVLVIGFGDLIVLRSNDLHILIFMSVFGFLFMRCVIADVTAAEVDSDEIRTTFLEQFKTLHLIMGREAIPKKLKNTVMNHLLHTWRRSKGLQPRDLFADLHPALESDLFEEFVGKNLQKVALLQCFTPSTLRTMSGFLRKLYFLRGTRLMRCGNLEYEMLIIITGKVYICDVHFNYLCTLSTGDCFGETSMIRGRRRCFNAVAITNCEAYILTVRSFEQILDRYPTILPVLLKQLRGGDRDYYEEGMAHKIASVHKMPPHKQERIIESITVRTEKIRKILSISEDLGDIGVKPEPWYSWRQLFGYGCKDEDLPFLYFCSARYKKIGTVFAVLIHPKCTAMAVILSWEVWLSYLTPAFATYETCFIAGDNAILFEKLKDNIVTKNVQKVSGILEIICLILLLLKFITPYETSEGVYCKTYRGIITRYVFSPTKFLVDLLGTLPFLVDLATTEDFQSNEKMKYVFLLKLVRLYRYFELQLKKKSNIAISTFRYKIVLSVSSFCLMAHMLACVFYGISSCNPTSKEDLCPFDPNKGETWTHAFAVNNNIKQNFEDFVAWKWWVRSLYWVVTTVSTTGFGDILPYSISEMGVAIICIFCGAFILSIILSHFTSGMESITKANRAYMYQVQLLVKHLRNIGLSKTRQDQVMMHFLMMWTRCRGTSYCKATEVLPLCLQIELCYHLFRGPLSNVPYFKGHDEESFIRQLSVRVSHSIFIPGVCIVKEGDQGKSMYIVYKGLVVSFKGQEVQTLSRRHDASKNGVTNTPPVEPKIVGVYKVGDVFGRFPALYREEAYQSSYRAETRVETLELRQGDILHLSEMFPYFKRNIMHLINSRYEFYGTGQNIFSDAKRARDNLFDLGENYKGTENGGNPEEKAKENKQGRDTKFKRGGKVEDGGGTNLDVDNELGSFQSHERRKSQFPLRKTITNTEQDAKERTSVNSRHLSASSKTQLPQYKSSTTKAEKSVNTSAAVLQAGTSTTNLQQEKHASIPGNVPALALKEKKRTKKKSRKIKKTAKSVDQSQNQGSSSKKRKRKKSTSKTTSKKRKKSKAKSPRNEQ